MRSKLSNFLIMSYYMSDYMSDYMFDYMSDYMPDYISDYMPDYMYYNPINYTYVIKVYMV